MRERREHKVNNGPDNRIGQYPAFDRYQPPTGYTYDRKSCKIAEEENFILQFLKSDSRYSI